MRRAIFRPSVSGVKAVGQAARSASEGPVALQPAPRLEEALVAIGQKQARVAPRR